MTELPLRRDYLRGEIARIQPMTKCLDAINE